MEIHEPIDLLVSQKIMQPLTEELSATFISLSEAFRSGKLFIEAQAIVESPYIHQEGGRLYCARAWKLLAAFSAQQKRLMAAKSYRQVNEKKLICRLEELLAENKLLPEQAQAIQEAFTGGISCIWGGPGTGKTYTAGWLVQLFLEQHPEAKVALTAPTGKATANLAASILRVTGSAFVAKTLHALLGLRPFGKKGRQAELAYDLILIDESSMIDLNLCVKLLSSVSEGTTLVFLGDPDQLAPVEAGEPFTALLSQSTKGHLTVSKRQEASTILDLAHLVKDAKAEEALFLLQNDLTGAISFHTEEYPFTSYVKALYMTGARDVSSLFRALSANRLLCPLREGKFGTRAVNDRLLKLLSKDSLQPIMITQNDYTLDLTNGQVGIIDKTHAYFEDGSKIPIVLLPAYETSYCLSVHKSQGSEFDEVDVLLPEGSERFGRKMLYTAITRAKKRLRLYGTAATLRACISTDSRPCTTFLPLS